MTDRIFLIGFMGSGKTTYGKILSRKLDWRFVDMDDRIAELTGKSVPEIFAQEGEDYFRMKESEVLQTLCDRKEVVVSTGGGVPCHNENMALMNRCGLTIYLKLPPAALLNRLLLSKTDRPLLRGKSEDEMHEAIVEMLRAREPYYKQAQLVIDGHADVVEMITRTIGIRKTGGQ